MSEALRRRRAAADPRAALTAAGHRDYPYDPARAAERLAASRITPEAREVAVARVTES